MKELKGFSGCKLLLCYSSERGYFVRKISKSADYNKRLKKQMKKQKLFYETFSNNWVTAPKIFSEGVTNDLYYFDMEYINGIDLIEFINRAKAKDLKEVTNFLLNLLKLFKAKKGEEKINLSEKFKEKISDIINKTKREEHRKLLRNLLYKSKRLPAVTTTYCHGDLTLENVIYNINKKKYYLIDFLDNFANHYWFDIVKIFQDVGGEWYLFRNKDMDKETMKIKMFFVKEMLIEKFLKRDPYIRYHNLFMALTFSRILPYCSEGDYWFVIKNIKKNLDKIN